MSVAGPRLALPVRRIAVELGETRGDVLVRRVDDAVGSQRGRLLETVGEDVGDGDVSDAAQLSTTQGPQADGTGPEHDDLAVGAVAVIIVEHRASRRRGHRGSPLC